LGCRQADLAQVFEVTQAAISYRLKRAIQRLKYLVEIPEGVEDDLEQLLPEVVTDPKTLQVVREMWVMTSQSHVAAKLGITQGQTRFKFMGALKRLEKAAETDPRFTRLAQAIRKLSENFNILAEIHGITGCRGARERSLEFL
jgi:hypothetical protein